MLKKEDIKMIIKVGLTLFLITAVSAFVLAFVNGLTSPVIAQNNEIKKQEALKKVMPDAEEFTVVENSPEEINEAVSEIYKAENTSGNLEGYAVMVSSMGYGGKITMVVGVDTDGTVTGLDIIEQSETPGLGQNCKKDEFKDQYIGKKSDIKVIKNGSEENSINAISSATITSKAVTKGVNEAIEAVLKAREEEE